MTTRQSIIKALESLPETTTIEEAMEKLYVLYNVQKDIEQADAGITVHLRPVMGSPAISCRSNSSIA